MQAIGEVISRLNNTRMGSTSEICYEHTVQANGKEYTKEIKKITFDGEIFCPICERDRTTQELSDEEDLKIERAMGRRKYNIFHNQSIVTDSELLNASFTNYQAVKKEEIDNKEKAAKAFTEYKDGETFTTWFSGDPGVGKSHLSMSILRNLNESGSKNKSCLYVEIEEMLSLIRDSYDNKESRYSERYFIELLSGVDYLVLDDLGAEVGGSGTKKIATDFVLRILKAVTNARQDKSTIVTTNLTRPELESIYDRRLVSRIMKDIFIIKFEDTTDKRIKKKEF